MTKPDWCPQDIWDTALMASDHMQAMLPSDSAGAEVISPKAY
jgi:hypothetical protein